MLRIIADDLGLAESVNDGIVFLLKEKKIDGVSLMANGEAFEDAVSKIKEMGIKYVEDALPHIGVHFVLVDEKPLSGFKSYKNYINFFFAYIFGRINKKGIEIELRAQIEKIISNGIKPAFINSHQHLHLLPGVMDIMISLAKKYGISYIRIIHEPLKARGSLVRKAQLCFVRLLSGMAKKRIIRNGLRCNDFFIGFLNAGNLSKSDIDLALKINNDYPDKIIELGCHPGFEAESLKIKYKHWGAYNWQKEIKMLQEYKLARRSNN